MRCWVLMGFHEPHFLLFLFIFILRIAGGLQEVSDFPKVTQRLCGGPRSACPQGLDVPFKVAGVAISWVWGNLEVELRV